MSRKSCRTFSAKDMLGISIPREFSGRMEFIRPESALARRGGKRSAVYLGRRMIFPEKSATFRDQASVSDHFGFGEQRFGHADRGDVDQAAIERDGALTLFRRLVHGFHDAPGLGHFGLGRAEDIVG